MVAAAMNTYGCTSCTVCYRVFYNLFWKISLQFLFHPFLSCLNMYCFPHVQYHNIQTQWEGAYLTWIDDSLVYSVLDLCGLQQNALLHSNKSTAVTAETYVMTSNHHMMRVPLCVYRETELFGLYNKISFWQKKAIAAWHFPFKHCSVFILWPWNMLQLTWNCTCLCW